MLGGETVNSHPTGVIFTPEEAWNMDQKIDDGKPGFGKMMIANWDTCTTGGANQADLANMQYDLTTTSIECMPIFPQFLE